MEDQLKLVIEKRGDWYVGSCPEIPSANGQGRSYEDCRLNLLQAILLLSSDEAEEAAVTSGDE